jgi:hypothetical protein
MRMDEEFRAALERAFKERQRAPSVSRNEWCERVAIALEIGRNALTDTQHALVAIASTAIPQAPPPNRRASCRP